MTKPAIGLWIDDAPKLVNTAAYFTKLKDHGVSTAAIMLESVGDGFDPKYSPQDLKITGTLARAADIELVLTVWPEPRKVYLDDLEKRIAEFIDASGAAGLEFDAESNWTTKKVAGFPNLDLAGDRFVEIFTKISTEHDVRTELTTFTGHGENSKSADVAPHVDWLLPQAYSVYKRKNAEGVDEPVAWDGRLGPGGMQKTTLDRALQVKGAPVHPKIACGLAAYDQVWPGKTGEEAMRVAYEAALKYSPTHLRYWSSKWVVGGLANHYSERFLLSIK